MTQGPFKIRNKMNLKNTASDIYSMLIQNSTLSANSTVTLPDFATNTLASTNNAQTFTGLQSYGAGISITGGTTNNFLAIQTGGTAATTKLTLSGTTWQIGGTTSTITEAGAFSGVTGVFSTSITSPIIYGATADNGDLTLIGTSSATKTTSNIYFGVAGAHGNINCANDLWTIGVVGTNGTGSSANGTHSIGANGTLNLNLRGSTGANTYNTIQWYQGSTLQGRMGVGADQLLTGAAAADLAITTQSGNLWIGKDDTGVVYAKCIAGTWSNIAGGSWGVISDSRLKKNIENLPNGLATILALRPVKYKWKDENVHALRPTEHFIADEVLAVNPRWVSISKNEKIIENGIETVIENVKQITLDASFNAYLVKAIQEQQDIINNLKSRIEKLEAKDKPI